MRERRWEGVARGEVLRRRRLRLEVLRRRLGRPPPPPDPWAATAGAAAGGGGSARDPLAEPEWYQRRAQ